MFSYAQAEKVLAQLHGADEAVQRGAFRGRLKHLKRLGIPLGSNPGRGQKTTYTREHLYQWAFCLELEEFGIDPTAIAALVAAKWEQIRPEYETARDKPGVQIYYVFQPQLMTASWSGGKPIDLVYALPVDKKLPMSVGLFTGSEQRLSMFNISSVVQAVEDAAAAAIGGAGIKSNRDRPGSPEAL